MMRKNILVFATATVMLVSGTTVMAGALSNNTTNVPIMMKSPIAYAATAALVYQQIKSETPAAQNETSSSDEINPSPVVVAVKENRAYPLTEQERDLIERVVSSEARGESLLGQMAVAQVIKDRAELWSKSVSQIVYAPSQFAKPYKGAVNATTKEAVSKVFDSGDNAVDGRITHFFNYKVCRPSWSAKKQAKATIGNHLFMY